MVWKLRYESDQSFLGLFIAKLFNMTLFGFCSWAKYHFFISDQIVNLGMYGSSSIIAQRWICLQKIAMRWKKGTAWNFLPNDKWNLEANTGLLIEAFFHYGPLTLSPIIFCSQMEQLHCSLPDLCLLCLLAASCKMAKKIVALLPPSLLPCTVVFSSAFTLYCFAENPLSLCNDQCIPRSKIIHHCQEEMFWPLRDFWNEG